MSVAYVWVYDFSLVLKRFLIKDIGLENVCISELYFLASGLGASQNWKDLNVSYVKDVEQKGMWNVHHFLYVFFM